MKLGVPQYLLIFFGAIIEIGIGIVLPAVVMVLVIRALWKYLHTKKELSASDEKAAEEAELCKTLGEALKAERTRCNMTQELVANSLGVSRQAVSKWENGTADPSTSNLLALAKLYGVSAEKLLKKVEQ